MQVYIPINSLYDNTPTQKPQNLSPKQKQIPPDGMRRAATSPRRPGATAATVMGPWWGAEWRAEGSFFSCFKSGLGLTLDSPEG